MNPPSKWPLVCAATLVGCVVGCVVGGQFHSGEKSAHHLNTSGPKSIVLTPAASVSPPQDVPTSADDESKHGETVLERPSMASVTSADDETKHDETALLSALREPNELRRAHVLYGVIEKMTPDEVASAIALAKRRPARDRATLLPMLVGKWAATDPREAMEFALGAGGPAFSDVIRAASNAWLSADQRGALEWARSLPAGGQRDGALYALATALSKSDPGAAMQFIGTLPKDQVSDTHYRQFWGEWAAQNPVDAGRQVLTLPHGRNRDDAIRMTLWHWAETHPQAALAWAGQLTDDRERREALTVAYQRWVGADPRAASTAVLALPPGDLRNLMIENIVRDISFRDVPTALRFIEQMPWGGPRHDAVQNVTKIWARRDPPAAAQYVASLPPGDTRNDGISNVAHTWARADAAAAFAWASQLPEGDRKEVKTAIVMGLAEVNLRAAADYVIGDQILPEADRVYDSGTLFFIVENWAREDRQSALAWVWQVGDENARHDLIGRLVRSAAETEPQEAAPLLDQLPADKLADATEVVAGLWGQRDAGAAAAWAMQLPEGEARDRAARTIAERWAAHDLVTAEHWLGTLVPGTFRDAAVGAFASSTSGTDPERAAKWAATISDPKMRTTEIERTTGKWLGSDKAAATRWITQSPALDDATKQRLLRGN